MTAEFHWDDARIFLAIARAGTLSGAADKMNMGIATVSRRLDRLEQALNVPLFSRHQSGYRLTDDGEALLARAEALEYAGLAFGEAAQLQGHVAGVVRLATSDNLATHFILPSLKGLLDHYPELRVEVLSGVQPVNLHRRDADLAIRMVKPEAGHLTLKRLGTVGFGVYGAADCLVGADGLSLSEADFVGGRKLTSTCRPPNGSRAPCAAGRVKSKPIRSWPRFPQYPRASDWASCRTLWRGPAACSACSRRSARIRPSGW